MADKREVKVAVVGDASQLRKVMSDASGHVDDFGKQAEKAGKVLEHALFGSAAILGAKKLVDASAELQQSVGGTAAVFEDASGSVSDFSKNAAELAGLSENAARTLTSRLGASLKGFGLSSEEAAQQAVFLTQTGADLAATLGGTTDEAVTALGAALRGEFDPLERFGIALKANDVNAKAVAMGLASSESSVSNYAKGQAALALITEKSAFAQGQFAREADTAAGAAQIANAKAQNSSADLGKALLPIYTRIVEAVSFVADAFASLPGPVQTGAIALGGVALFAKPAYEAISAVNSAVKAIPDLVSKMTDKLVDTTGAFKTFGQTSEMAGGAAKGGALQAAGGMSVLGPAVLGVGVAVGVGAAIWKSYSDEQARVRKEIDNLRDALDDQTGALTDSAYATVRKTLEDKNQIDNLNKAGISVREFTDVLDDNRDSLVRQGEVETILDLQMRGHNKIVAERIQKIREQGGTQNELIARLLETEAADRGLIDTLYNGIDAYNEEQKAIEENATEKANAEGKTKDLVKSEAALKQEVEKAAAAIKDQTKAILDQVEAGFNLEERQIATRKALADYNKAVADGTLTADERKSKELDLAEAIYAEAKAAAEAFIATNNLKGTQGEAAASAKAQSDRLGELAKTLAPDSPLRKGIEDTAFQLFLFSLQDPKITIGLETKAALDKFKAFIELIGGYGPEGTVDLGAIWAYSQAYPDARAAGGPVMANTPYMVGELGPELFVPKTSGMIVPANQTADLLAVGAGGGATYNISVNVPPTVDKATIGQSIVEAITQFERRSGSSWRAA